MPRNEFSEQLVVVSGASGGIGTEMCRRFTAAGASVAALDFDVPSAGTINLACDLSSDESVVVASLKVKEGLGEATIVVHAAAVSEHATTLESSSEAFMQMYNVNVLGALRLVQAFSEPMKRRGKGCFILLSSINGSTGAPGLAGYAASKGALDTFTKTLSLELAGDNIRVNAIAPASIDTPLLRQSFNRSNVPETARTENVMRHPLGRLGTPSDVASLALFLASDESSWITGGIHYLDGGAYNTRR